MCAVNFTLPDEAATARLGVRLARHLGPGDLVRLFGDLGAGKTTLARSIIKVLTGESDAPSPTYTLVQSYETENGWPLAHADLYRLEDEDELDELGLDEAFELGAALVEWPSQAPSWRPANRLEVRLVAEASGQRSLTLTGFGIWKDRLDEF